MTDEEVAIEEVVDSQAPYIMREILLKDITSIIDAEIKSCTYDMAHCYFYKQTLNQIIHFCNEQIKRVNETT